MSNEDTMQDSNDNATVVSLDSLADAVKTEEVGKSLFGDVNSAVNTSTGYEHVAELNVLRELLSDAYNMFMANVVQRQDIVGETVDSDYVKALTNRQDVFAQHLNIIMTTVQKKL